MEKATSELRIEFDNKYPSPGRVVSQAIVRQFFPDKVRGPVIKDVHVEDPARGTTLIVFHNIQRITDDHRRLIAAYGYKIVENPAHCAILPADGKEAQKSRTKNQAPGREE